MSSIPISQVPSVTKEVAQKFHSLRFKFLLARMAILILLAISSGLLLWFCLATIDYLLEIRLGLRQSALLVGIGLGLAIVLTILLRNLRWSRARAFTSLLEFAFESFGQRIRTVLDTVEGKVSGPPEMLAALGHQTLGRWETLAPSQIIPQKLLMVSAVLCTAMMAGTLCSLVGQGEWKTAMLRTIGLDIPYTTLEVKPGNEKILEGKEVEVGLKLIGRQNRDVQLRYKLLAEDAGSFASDASDNSSTEAHPKNSITSTADSSEWISYDLERGDGGDFSYRFGQAKVPIEYQFVTSAGTTDVYRIDIQPLIVALRTEIHVTPPTYTGLDARTFSSTEVTVLERSTVNVRVETNHPLSTVRLETGERLSKLTEATASIAPTGTEVTFELPAVTSLHWTLNATGKDGTPMTTLKGRLRVREDTAPTIRWQDPQDEIRVHTLAELPMRAQVSDDYGVVEAGIMFRIGDDEEFELTKKSIDDLTTESDKTATSINLDELLPLESFSLTERDYVSYYAFAVDNREWGNQRIETEVRYIDIRPLRQYFAEIELDPNQSGGGRLIVQLDEIIRRQRHLISRTRKLEKSNALQSTDNVKVIDRMVQAESELAGLTRFLADFFVSRGNDDVEALNQAEAAMLQASDSLSAMNLGIALTQEEDGLRSLAEARRELEVAIAKGTRAQQQQFSQAAQQLRQKLRREADQTEQQLADTLERIASEQMQLSQRMSNSTQENATSLKTNSGANGNAENSSGESTNPVGKPSESNTLSEAEQREEWFSQQVELLERVQAIETQLSNRLEKSKLMAQRMQEVKADMDNLSKMARSGTSDLFHTGSNEVADNLRELSVQLAALASTEAVNRVSSLRDMTLSMAERERDLAESTEKTQARRANRLARRAETIADVLAAPSDVGDVSLSEVKDTLDKFVDSNDFLEKLSQSQSVGEQMAEKSKGGSEEDKKPIDQESGSKPSNADAEQAVERARDYADAAAQLEALYRQLVSPRVARLRQLEQKATLLNQQLAGQGEQSENKMGTKGKINELQRELTQEGLGGLAEILDPSQEEMDKPGPSRYGLAHSSSVQNRVEVVVKELRESIQELILLEVAADRDAPVPATYRTAVDGYFRAIAGESDEP